jgi:hypothetical protein
MVELNDWDYNRLVLAPDHPEALAERIIAALPDG